MHVASSNRYRFMRGLAITLAVCLVIACGACITMAYYFTSISGSSTANVAKWHIEVNDENITAAEPQAWSFGLFDTIYDEDCEGDEDYVSEGFIAPGTGGRFQTKIENFSNVDAEYTLALSATNAHNVPIQFSLDKSVWFNDLNIINLVHEDVFLDREDGSKTFTIYWRWPSDGYGSSESNTNIGIAGQTENVSYIISAELSVVQVQTATVKTDPLAIAVTKQPDKVEYLAGSNFDKTGMQVHAFYKDGSTKDVTDSIEISGGNSLTGDVTSVSISYEENDVERTINLPITVNEPTAILYSDGTMVFQSNATADTSHGSVVATYPGVGSWLTRTYFNSSNVPWYADGNYASITSVIIEDGISPVSQSNYESMSYWFYDASNLISATIGDGVTSIGTYAFYNCSQLTSVGDLSNVTTIGYYAFNDCSQLTSVDLSNVTSIGYYAFTDCSKLESVGDLSNVTSIGFYAFYNCSQLTSVGDLSNVASIGHNAFFSCSKLTNVDLSNVTSIGQSTFYNCSQLTNVGDLSNVTTIGDYAFFSCSKLTNVDLSNVASIGQCAFYNCSQLTSVGDLSNVTSISEMAFQNCSQLTSVDLSNVTSIGMQVFSGCSQLTNVGDLSNVTTIGAHAFSGCSKLTEFTFGDGVTSVGTKAFYVDSSVPTTINGGNDVVKAYDWEGSNRTVTFN